MRLSIAKCVWGARYVRTMLDANLPSLLAPNNVPAAAARAPLEHVLVTTPADRVVIESDPTYQALARLIPCRIELMNETPVAADYMGTIDRMNRAHRQILADCRAHGSAWIFDQPDHVWGNGSLDHLAGLAVAGVRCALFAGIRTNREDMLPVLGAWRDGPMVDIDNRVLLRLAIEHMHVHDRVRFWGPPASTIGPHHVNWRVGPHSFLRRVFYAQPFLLASPKEDVEPHRSVDLDYVERAYAPSELHYIANSTDFLVVELSGRLEFRDHIPQPLTVPYLSAWTHRFVTDRQMDVFSWPIRFQGDDTAERRWRRMERFSFRIEQAVRRMRGLYAAQAALAADRPLLAALLGRLLREPSAHRLIDLSDKSIFFAPPDAVLAEWLELPSSQLLAAVPSRLARDLGTGVARLSDAGRLEVELSGGSVSVEGLEMVRLRLPGPLDLYVPALLSPSAGRPAGSAPEPETMPDRAS